MLTAQIGVNRQAGLEGYRIHFEQEVSPPSAHSDDALESRWLPGLCYLSAAI